MEHPEPSFTKRIPPGDDRPRSVCDTCGWVDYVNPRVVVGSVVTAEVDGEERILLCRRAIHPRRGFWTLPAGYLEEGETAADGAAREAREEAEAQIEIGPLLALYDVPKISQIQLFFRARLIGGHVAPGPESLNTVLFRWDDIPWTALAFHSVGWALHHWRDSRALDAFPPFRNPEA